MCVYKADNYLLNVLLTVKRTLINLFMNENPFFSAQRRLFPRTMIWTFFFFLKTASDCRKLRRRLSLFAGRNTQVFSLLFVLYMYYILQDINFRVALNEKTPFSGILIITSFPIITARIRVLPSFTTTVISVIMSLF